MKGGEALERRYEFLRSCGYDHEGAIKMLKGERRVPAKRGPASLPGQLELFGDGKRTDRK